MARPALLAVFLFFALDLRVAGVGRSYRDAPEVDGVVLVQREMPVGKMARVQVSGAMEYDLLAQVEGDSTSAAHEHEPLLQIAEPAQS